MNARHVWLLALLIGSAPRLSAAVNPADAPATIPTCAAPQPLAPLQPVGGTAVNYGGGTAVAWNGQDYGTLWIDAGGQLKFRRVYSDGSPAGAVVALPVGTTYAPNRPVLLWNGAGYGAVWTGFLGGVVQIYFARLTPDGALVVGGGSNPVMVSNYGGSPATNAFNPAAAWNGTLYAVTWGDNRNAGTLQDIYATLINADGTIAGGGALHDLAVSTATNAQSYPAIAWSTGGNTFLIVWYDFRGGAKYELYRSTLSAGGAAGANTLLVSMATTTYNASLVDSGTGLGMTWFDSGSEIYFARLDGYTGAKLGTDVRLTNDANSSQYPTIVWTGGEYGIFWADNRSGNYDIWYQRVSAAGAAVGGNVQITTTNDMGISPQAAWGRTGFLLTAVPLAGTTSAPNFAMPVGCANDATPPSCPGGYVAYSITGATATIGWLPSGDAESDLAYYKVYRNSQLIGKTSATYYNDSGLGLSTTYAYAIQPVNAGQLQNYNCQALLYLKTNASLTLTMSKTDPNAQLDWTDAGMGSYSIFRGTDPRVMSQIGASTTLTAQDPNALIDTVSYFYTVDDPGQ